MATVFLDEFNGSGALDGRTPDVGTAWGPSYNDDCFGNISGGRLEGATPFGNRFFSGYFKLPPSGFSAMTFRLSYQIAPGGLSTELRAVSGGVNGQMFRASNKDYEPLVIMLTPLPDLASVALAPGTHELIIALDFVSDTMDCYLDGSNVLSGIIPGDAIEEDYYPTPGISAEYNFYGYSDDSNHKVYGVRLEVSDDLYTPDTPGFWTQRVRCQEVI